MSAARIRVSACFRHCDEYKSPLPRHRLIEVESFALCMPMSVLAALLVEEIGKVAPTDTHVLFLRIKCQELLDEVVDGLCRRYYHIYGNTRDSVDRYRLVHGWDYYFDGGVVQGNFLLGKSNSTIDVGL